MLSRKTIMVDPKTKRVNSFLNSFFLVLLICLWPFLNFINHNREQLTTKETQLVLVGFAITLSLTFPLFILIRFLRRDRSWQMASITVVILVFLFFINEAMNMFLSLFVSREDTMDFRSPFHLSIITAVYFIILVTMFVFLYFVHLPKKTFNFVRIVLLVSVSLPILDYAYYRISLDDSGKVTSKVVSTDNNFLKISAHNFEN